MVPHRFPEMGLISGPPIVKRLDKFTTAEFSAWEHHIETQLKWANLFFVLQCSFEEVQDSMKKELYDRCDKLARLYLLNCLCNRHIDTYRDCATAKEIWDRLHVRFFRRGEIPQGEIHIRMLRFEFKEDENVSMSSQVAELEELSQALNNEEAKFSDELLEVLIIHKLPSSWEAFRTEMMEKTTRVRLVELKRLIQVEEENRARSKFDGSGTSGTKPEANHVAPSQKQPKQKRVKRAPTQNADAPANPQAEKKIEKTKGSYK